MSAAPRIAPADPPYPPEIQARFDALMPPGVAPLVLFRTLARDQRLFQRFMGGGLLDKGHLTLRQREIVIDRVTARCGSRVRVGRARRLLRQARRPRRGPAALAGARGAERCLLEAPRTRC